MAEDDGGVGTKDDEKRVPDKQEGFIVKWWKNRRNSRGQWSLSDELNLARLLIAMLGLLISADLLDFSILEQFDSVIYHEVKQIETSERIITYCSVENTGRWINELNIIVESVDNYPFVAFVIENERRNHSIVHDPRDSNSDPSFLSVSVPYLIEGDSLSIVVETDEAGEVTCKPAAENITSRLRPRGTRLNFNDILIIFLAISGINIATIYFIFGKTTLRSG